MVTFVLRSDTVAQTSDKAEFSKALQFLKPRLDLEYIAEFFKILTASRLTAVHLACFVLVWSLFFIADLFGNVQ